ETKAGQKNETTISTREAETQRCCHSVVYARDYHVICIPPGPYTPIQSLLI
ncbi:unnamed protein product, partial [Brassica oleracea]